MLLFLVLLLLPTASIMVPNRTASGVVVNITLVVVVVVVVTFGIVVSVHSL